MKQERAATPPSDTAQQNWTEVDRGGWPVWTHNTKLVWAVEYDALPRTTTDNGRPAFWAVYYAIEKRQPGRAHWAHNNKSLGNFPTLEAALAAGDAYVE